MPQPAALRGGTTSVGAVATTDVGRLVEAAAAGDHRAWERLVERFTGLIWSITLGFRLSRADAADVNQTCWLRLVEHLGRLAEPDRVGSWLATTARHECLAVLRRSGREVPTEHDDERAAAVLAPPDARLHASERAQALWAAFSALPPRDQALLHLLITDPPVAYAEIAAALDMAVGSIGPTKSRCLARLRGRLAALGVDPDDLRP